MNTAVPIAKPASLSDRVTNRLSLALARPWTYILMGGAILWLDVQTGPYLLFPILFVVPVTLTAWFYSARLAYLLALFLPVGRIIILTYETTEQVDPAYLLANACIRMGVLLFLAFLVARTSALTKALKERITGLVTICAWSKTVRYQGEWISFEDYLKRRFGIDVTHGISPAEAQRLIESSKTEISSDEAGSGT